MTGEDRKAYSPERLDEAVAQVAELAGKNGVKVALCGGLAMQSYGSDRLTKDVDFVASGRIEGLVAVRPLTFGGMETTAPNGVPVDLILRADVVAELYQRALETAQERPAVPCPVVLPEFLAAMKLVAGRQRDLFDLYFLINSGVLDIAKARSVVDRFGGGWYAAKDFVTKVEDAKLEAERERRQRGG